MMSRFLASCSVALLLVGTAFCGEAADPVAVELSTPRRQYLPGEPVLLDVAIRNTTPHPISAARTPDVYNYIRVFVGRKDQADRLINQAAERAKVGLTRTVLKPDEPWTYQLRVLNDFRFAPDGQIDRDLAFPGPGTYTAKIEYPLIGAIPEAGTISVPNKSYGSNSIQVQIQTPQGEDIEVFEAIKDWNTRYFLQNSRPLAREGNSREAVRKVARLLKEYPRSGYRDALRRALLEYYRKSLINNDPEDPVREEVRSVLGEPDNRLFPHDERLGQELVLNSPSGTRFRNILASLQDRTGVPLAASPYYRRDEAREGFLPGRTWTLRKLMRFTGPLQDGAAWVRRGEGYYLYCETFNDSPRVRKILRDQLGPLPVLFPDDKRLDAEVAIDFPKPTPITRVLADYAEQSGVPLDASPFFQHCVQQSNEAMTHKLREEMAYLARTFRAKWVRRGEGYFLEEEPLREWGDLAKASPRWDTHAVLGIVLTALMLAATALALVVRTTRKPGA